MRQACEGGSAVVWTEQSASTRFSIAIGTSRRKRGSRALARDAPIHWTVGVETLGFKSLVSILYNNSRQTTDGKRRKQIGGMRRQRGNWVIRQKRTEQADRYEKGTEVRSRTSKDQTRISPCCKVHSNYTRTSNGEWSCDRLGSQLGRPNVRSWTDSARGDKRALARPGGPRPSTWDSASQFGPNCRVDGSNVKSSQLTGGGQRELDL